MYRNMSKNDILELVKQGENEFIEFKESKNSFPNDALETISAFANTDGGIIVLGIKELENGKFIIEGVDRPQKIIDDFHTKINNPGLINRNLFTNKDIEKIIIDTESAIKTIIIIHVRREAYKHRPIFLKNHPYLSYFRRGSSDIQCSAESVKAMLRDSSLEPYDNKILPKYTINDLDDTTIEQYRNKFNELHPEHPFTKLINIDFLEKIQAVRINRETGEVNVTVAGLLVFGKHTSIKEEIPHYNIEYINKSGMDSNLYYKDRLIYDGTWGEDNIYNFFNKAIEKLYMSIHETSDIGEDSITRRSSSLLKVAIREALVNSLVHCDYLAHEGILVIRYSDRFIFKNGGTLRIPTQDFFAGGYSDPRNNIIQEIFRHIGLCERAGSGIPKIMTAVEKNKYKYPQISVNQSSFELILWDTSIISSENITDEKEIEIVKLAISNYVITISDVTKLLSIHRNTASKYLNKLVEKEIFVKVKSGNENKYSIASDEKFDKYNFVNLLKTMSEELKRN